MIVLVVRPTVRVVVEILAVLLLVCALGLDASSTEAECDYSAVLRRAESLRQSDSLELADSLLSQFMDTSLCITSIDSAQGSILGFLAQIQRERNRYQDALQSVRRAYGIRDSLLSDEDERRISTLNDLAALFIENGKYDSGVVALHEVLRSATTPPGSVSLDWPIYLSNLAVVHFERGDYAEALFYCDSCARSLAGDSSQSLTLAECLTTKAFASLEQHDTIGAMLNMRQALELWQAGDLLDLVRALNNSSDVSNQLGNCALAVAYADSALNVGREMPQAGQIRAMSYLARAQAKSSCGEFLAADSAAQTGISILKALQRDTHSDLGRAYLIYADIKDSLNQPDSALWFVELALETLKSSVGDLHDLTAQAKLKLAEKESLSGRPIDALTISLQAFRTLRANFLRNARIMTPKQAREASAVYRHAASLVMDIFYNGGDLLHSCDSVVAEVVLAYKGSINSVFLESRRDLLAARDTLASATLDSLLSATRAFSNLSIASSTAITVFSQRVHDSLASRVDSLDSRLAWLGYGRAAPSRDSTSLLLSIRRALGEKSVLYEFLRFGYQSANNSQGSARYVAVLIDKNRGPHIVDCGDADSLDATISCFNKLMEQAAGRRNGPTDSDRLSYLNSGESLYVSFWEKISALVPAESEVYVAPDGLANFISFAGLPLPGDQFLGDSLRFHYVTAGKDLAVGPDANSISSGNKNLLAIGNPNFDTVSACASLDDKQGISRSVTTGPRPRSPDLKALEQYGYQWDRLPGTKSELDTIAALWQQNTGEDFTIVSDSNASECAVRSALQNGYRVVHFATHGFYARLPSISEVLDDPLLRGGLVLAGANLLPFRKSWTIDDQILTAYEIGALNLSGVGMVVLSACETGVGLPRDGECVSGLRSAFRYAGAEVVACALWELNDTCTFNLMRAVYKELGTKPFVTAFSDAEREQIASMRATGVFPHPALWASFIVEER